MKKSLIFLFLIICAHTITAQQNVNLDSLKSIWINENLSNEDRWMAVTKAMQVLDKKEVQPEDFFFINNLLMYIETIDRDGEVIDLTSAVIQKIRILLDASSCLDVEVGNCYRRLAGMFSVTGNIPLSIELYLKALKIYELKGASSKIAVTYGSLGHTYAKLRDYNLTDKYYLQSIEIYKQTRDSSNLAYKYMQLMYSQMFQKEMEDAMVYIDSAIVINKALKDDISIAKNKVAKADLLLMLNRPQEALEIQLESLPIVMSEAKKTGNSEWLAFLYGNMGESYLDLEEYEKALNCGRLGLKYAEGYLAELKGSQEIIYVSLEELGRKAEAFDAYKKFNEIRDSILNAQNIKEATTLEMNYKFQQERFADSLEVAKLGLKKDLEFQQKLSREKVSRNIFIALGIGILLFAIGVLSRLRFIRKTKLALEEKNVLIEAETKRAKASEESKQQFLANMSHEIRTPMNAIKGMTDILLRRNPQAQQLNYLQAIKESSNSLLVIINDILDISKIEAGKIDLEYIPFSLEEVVQNVATIMQFKAEEQGLLLQNKLPKDLPKQIVGDPTRLHQILLNLIGNGIKFTDKGVVSCELKTVCHPEEEQLEAQFCISDTGVGIGKDRLEKIFDTFEQAYSDTTRKFGGTGLGLSISKKLVELQKGRIWVESEKGKGSQFYFSIPYQTTNEIVSDLSSEKILANEQLAAQLKGIKILLVEDNSFNAIVAQEELEDVIKDIQVDVAENGVIALEKVKLSDYDLILMDVQMPVMNGYEATQKIRSLENGKASIPIIAMTANVMEDEVARCYEAGMNDFIGKPFDTNNLIRKIRKLISK